MASILAGLGGFSFAFWYVLFHHGHEFTGFFDPGAFVLLTVAPLSVIFMSHSFHDFFGGLGTLISMAVTNHTREMVSISNQLSAISSGVRNEGMGVLAKFKGQLRNAFFRDGLGLILSSFTTEEIRHNMIAKINTKQIAFGHASNLFESLGKLCPGMGLVGTIIGLVQMLSNLTDPSKLGSGMAVSLLSTLYGLILGTVIYTPVSEKIRIFGEKSLQLDQMILEGVLLLKEKKSTAHFRDVVNTYSAQDPSRSKAPGRAS